MPLRRLCLRNGNRECVHLLVDGVDIAIEDGGQIQSFVEEEELAFAQKLSPVFVHELSCVVGWHLWQGCKVAGYTELMEIEQRVVLVIETVACF